MVPLDGHGGFWNSDGVSWILGLASRLENFRVLLASLSVFSIDLIRRMVDFCSATLDDRFLHCWFLGWCLSFSRIFQHRHHLSRIKSYWAVHCSTEGINQRYLLASFSIEVCLWTETSTHGGIEHGV